MPEWKGIVGSAFSVGGFGNYCKSLKWSAWRPSFIVLHNTFIPSLPDCKNGFTSGSMDGFVRYYRDEQGWSAGPHLFIDDHQIWVFTPLTVSGVHSPSWNNVALGVEMLGNYDVDDFDSGRGLIVQQNAVAAVATLSYVLGLDPTVMKLHKEDILTEHKDCPGAKVKKQKFIELVQSQLFSKSVGDHLKSRVI
jgi:hypothetical protein